MNPTYVLLVVVLFVTVALGLEGLHQIWASKHSAGAKQNDDITLVALGRTA